jgi:hypothetical protein
MCNLYASREGLYANNVEPLAANKLTPPLSGFIKHSKRSHPSSFKDSLENPCKRRRCVAKKAVTFSSTNKLRRFFNDNNLQVYSSWHTDDELSSMKKRAKKLSMFHCAKTHPGQAKAPSKRSGIVYNCHPAHYEIIEESLRGMEHHTDISKARRQESLRSDAISLVVENQDTSRSKLACIYRESAKEAMSYSREIAEEDAKVAAAILAEDLKQDDVLASTSSCSPSVSSSAVASSA